MIKCRHMMTIDSVIPNKTVFHVFLALKRLIFLVISVAQKDLTNTDFLLCFLKFLIFRKTLCMSEMCLPCIYYAIPLVHLDL